ncbi:AraC family transcriptional regulator [Terrimonas sp. NA20]|uniref:AraC family transcriptional regulator n=1 Tax=Terrimonas ginsenosidimutans TaxID=2908004 RepID=A0ABS9KMW0_9BACT|nr:helix-turn-helix domain-containing protein [Terrimonas ginsenosidimutans]MCG2613646.1 AraC family transcriptional regulator [Terrimonas ginsenosidimutans]
MPEVSNTTIKHLKLGDLLEMTGQSPQHSGLHVFSKTPKKKEHGGHHIDYPFRVDAFFIIIVTDSSLHIKLNLTDYHLQKNDVLVVGPNTVRQFIDAGEGCCLTGIMFTPDFLMQAGISKKYYGAFDFFAASGSPFMRMEEAEADELLELISILHKKNHEGSAIGGEYQEEVVKHHFLAFMFELASLYRKSHAQEKIRLTRKEELMKRFLKLLPEHARQQRGLQFYADHLYVTPKYLSQTVKELSGKTAGAFIDELVMVEAKVLLGDLSLSVAQVADQLFFSDQFFFSKFFKNHAGITPTGYRKTF